MLRIKSHLKKYNVNFDQDLGFLEKLTLLPNTEYVIDRKVYELYEKNFKGIPQNRLYLLDALEENKTIETALDICDRITNIPAKRNATIVSVGGGIVQDITGFVANITYRGINWIFVPTTLLSACDSCIGAKTSLNYKNYKNLFGTFYPPDEIFICSLFFNTLSERDYKSGLGEVVKFNIMKGLKGLCCVEKNINSLLQRDHSLVNSYVLSSLRFKKHFIEADEFDRGERILLNFAHTFGHSIEVVSEYNIPHGTAVAIGMIMADAISEKRGYITSDIQKRIENALYKVIDIDIRLLDKPYERFIDAIKKDKKQIDDNLTAVLITNFSDEAELSVLHDVSNTEIIYAIDCFKEKYENKSI